MEMFTGIPDAIAALRTYEREAMRSGDLRDHLMEAINNAATEMSSAVALSNATEALFANLKDLDDDGKKLGARMCALATFHGWHGLSKDGRGDKIIFAFCRELGMSPAIGSYPEPEDDPQPKAKYMPPAEPEPDAEVDVDVDVKEPSE